jgi:hypothetical protein
MVFIAKSIILWDVSSHHVWEARFGQQTLRVHVKLSFHLFNPFCWDGGIYMISWNDHKMCSCWDNLCKSYVNVTLQISVWLIPSVKWKNYPKWSANPLFAVIDSILIPDVIALWWSSSSNWLDCCRVCGFYDIHATMSEDLTLYITCLGDQFLVQMLKKRVSLEMLEILCLSNN